MQHDRPSADHGLELAPINFALRAWCSGLRNEDALRHLAGSELDTQPCDHEPALRFGDQHAMLLREAITDPFRRVPLLRRRRHVISQNLTDPVMPHAGQRRGADRGLAQRRLG